MAVNAQFLFFYIDELLRHHWVDWLEGPLSEEPDEDKRTITGFQDSLGDRGAGPRTRANEAYKLGILSDRIVKPRAAGSRFPSGWQMVIDGQVPTTRLGIYSYIIGYSLRANPNLRNLKNAVDILVSILILHIGFKRNGRWYCTVSLFRFAQEQLEEVLGRPLIAKEIRYLTAAVINTAESDQSDLLLAPYTNLVPIQQLQFTLADGESVVFDFLDLPEIVMTESPRINEFYKTKAMLYWADQARGIFSSAARSRGIDFISEFTEIDRLLSNNGEPNLLHPVLEDIDNNRHNSGIFEFAETGFSDFAVLNDQWNNIETELFAAANLAIETIELDAASPFFIQAQRTIRENEYIPLEPESSANTTEPGERINLKDADKPEKNEVLNSAQPEKSNKIVGEKLRREKSKTVKKLNIEDILANDFDNIKTSIPSSEPRKLSQKPKTDRSEPRVTKTDFAARDARNKALGDAGEEFIFEYEGLA